MSGGWVVDEGLILLRSSGSKATFCGGVLGVLVLDGLGLILVVGTGVATTFLASLFCYKSRHNKQKTLNLV